MIRCNKQGCRHEATHHLSFMVWGMGVPRDQRVAATAIIGSLPLPLCRHHAALAQPAVGLFNEATWAKIRNVVFTRHGSAPSMDSILILSQPGLPEDLQQPN